MHNCSSEHIKPQESKPVWTLVSTTSPVQPALVLLVERHNSPQSPKLLIEADPRYCAINVHTAAEMIDLRDEDISVAVLSVALGFPVLRSAAMSVRRHWPSATILLQGQVKIDFDDFLYDTAIDPLTDPDGLKRELDAIAKRAPHRLLTRSNHQKTPSAGLPLSKAAVKSGLSGGVQSIQSPRHGSWTKVLNGRGAP